MKSNAPGDGAEFAAYVADRYVVLTRTAYLLTGNRHQAEDLVQSALARTYLAWARVVRADDVDAYVRRILVNEHLSWWRRAWRHREVLAGDPPEPVSTVGHTGETDRTAHSVELWDAIGRLSPKLRSVIVLRYYEDLSEAETADLLECSLAAVKSRAHRAIAQLRAALYPDLLRRAGSGRVGTSGIAMASSSLPAPSAPRRNPDDRTL